jgi:hypothetical protein
MRLLLPVLLLVHLVILLEGVESLEDVVGPLDVELEAAAGKPQFRMPIYVLSVLHLGQVRLSLFVDGLHCFDGCRHILSRGKYEDAGLVLLVRLPQLRI